MEVNFIYEGQEYFWYGDYTITNYGEQESEYAPSYGETEITIDNTISLYYFHPITDQIVDLTQTPSILMQLEIEIERNL